ncbi:MAG: type II toxin-antitoxin system RelE/ParE family toxin [Pseudomonadota bacterium]
MTRRIRLTMPARAQLADILEWTVETFGTRQAERYQTAILGRIKKAADGLITGRPCKLLDDDPHLADLVFLRAGEHFVIYRLTDNVLGVIAIIHSRSDVPSHIAAALTNMKDD